MRHYKEGQMKSGGKPKNGVKQEDSSIENLVRNG